MQVRTASGMGSWRLIVFDSREPFLHKWNKMFAISCFFALCLDPLFLYVPVIDGDQKCLKLDLKLLIIACVLRSAVDIFYILHIIFQFFTGFIAPSYRVFGTGVLVCDHRAIAKRYITSYFFIDFLAILPLPQVVVLAITHLGDFPISLVTNHVLGLVVLAQYVPRLLRIYPIFKDLRRKSGVIAETSLLGAANSLLLYLIASHVIGAFWYLLSIEQQLRCWLGECKKNECDVSNLYCHKRKQDFVFRNDFSFMNASCPLLGPDEIKDSRIFDFGIFVRALQSKVVESDSFFRKLFYCLWWGIRNVSSLGQNLETSTHPSEILFAAFISIFGLVLVSLLIGHMIQKYLQSATVREEDMRVKRQDFEQWMSHRMLPEELKDRIRRYEQYKWQENRGVEEETLILNLPKDLRRDIKRHLCVSLLRRVAMFERVDEVHVDAMCDRLKPVLYTENSYILREGDPVDEMLFIMRGRVSSVTTNGGRTGFFNLVCLKAGDFCGEELLYCCFDPYSTNIPRSSRKVKALTEVEAFSLMAADFKSVFSMFPLVYTKQLHLSLRCTSLDWRTWAASFIQVAWRQRAVRKLHKCLIQAEEGAMQSTMLQERVSPQLLVQKPVDPDFAYVSKRKMETGDMLMEEMKLLKVGIGEIAAALDCTCGNKPRSYSEEQLYEEIEKVGGMSDEMQMEVYQALSGDLSIARAFLACPVKRRALWLKVKYGASFGSKFY